MGYYLVYGSIVAIAGFFVYYFMLGGRMALAQEITRFIVAFGFFLVLFAAGFFSSRKKIKRAKDEGSTNDTEVYINNRVKWQDRIVSLLLGGILLMIAIYDDSLDFIDFMQAFITVVIHYCWHHYLFITRRAEPYSTISALSYLDKIKDYLVVLLLPLAALLVPLAGKDFNSTDAMQASCIFIVAYLWHKFLFAVKKTE
jgi:hypothetical protein